MTLTPQLLIVSALNFAAAFLLIRYGWPAFLRLLARQERWYQRVLNEQLILDVPPRLAVALSLGAVGLAFAFGWVYFQSLLWGLVCAVVAGFLPNLLVRNLEKRRLDRLEEQLVDAVTLLASGVRAGLNLVQSMELLVQNMDGPIKQEFAHLLHEYQMGLDLNQAMRNASDRIGSPNYRLLFTAVEMHRIRGGDTAESLDRIAESIREIQRLEGKLDAITAQGRYQAWAMAVMPFVFLIFLYAIDPEGVRMLFLQPLGRVILLVTTALIAAAYYWIRRILSVDI